MHKHLQYRPHIDGMRAIAVSGVLLYHFGAEWLPGGFLGVDIFFVISGFLISRSIFAEVERGEFSLRSFYERRARRILPAFMAITAFTGIAAVWLFILPMALSDFAKSAVAGVLFASNVFFYLTTDYFSPAANEVPLLHYWSLGVEEQFYLLFPLVVLAINRGAKRWLSAIVVLMFASSLIACIAVRGVDPSAAFYLLPFRAFEILVGSILALKGVRFPQNQGVAAAFSTTGLALCLVSFFILDEDMALPGLLSLLPCLGAAFIIYGGERSLTPPTAVLQAPALLFIGRISYSLYLVHWPVAVFMNETHPAMSSSLFLTIGISLSLGLAYLSYAFVERPTRTSGRVGPFRIGRFFGVSSACAIVAASVVIVTGGLPDRLSADVQKVISFNKYDYQDMMRSGVCFMMPTNVVDDFSTSDCLPSSNPRVLLWGDSTMAQYAYGLEPALREHGVAMGQLTSSSCLPIADRGAPGRPNCLPFNRMAIDLILKSKPDAVVMGGVWSARPVELTALKQTLVTLEAAGIKTILLGPAVYYKSRVPKILAKRLIAGDRRTGAADDIRQDVTVDRDKVMQAFAEDHPSLIYISVVRDLCNGECSIAENGIPLHFDAVHFTREGSIHYARKLSPLVLKSLTTAPR